MNRLPRWASLILLAVVSAVAGAQTVVTTSTTIQNATTYPFGLVIGGGANYQQNQYYKNLNYFNGGDMPSVYWDTSFTAQTGGTNSTTEWYNNDSNNPGYPAGFWNGATYRAYAVAPTLLGTGTITGYSGNVSSGNQFTLGTALSAPGNTTNQDVLIVNYFNAPHTLTTPNNIWDFYSAGASFLQGDTSPASTNTIQSLEMTNGSTVTYYMDGGNPGTNTNPAISGATAEWVNINGTYTVTFKAKCLTAGCTVAQSLGRLGGANYSSGTVSPTFNTTPGAGWQTYYCNPSGCSTSVITTTGTENANQTELLEWVFNITGTAALQDIEFIEGSTLAGNNTVYRDAVVRQLESLHLGSLRHMDGSNWCDHIPTQEAGGGNNSWCSFSTYAPFSANAPGPGYDSKLALCALLNVDCWLTVGLYNQAADFATLPTWLSTNANYITIKNAGHKVWIEHGNEAWNFGSQGQMSNGGGTVYGVTLGQNVAAFKGASGYDATHMKTIGDGWIAQGYTGLNEWGVNTMNSAAASGSKPDCVDNAVYMWNYLESFATSGSNVSTTSTPWPDLFAEDANFNIASPSGGYSMNANTAGALSAFGVCMGVYEADLGAYLFGGVPTTNQLQQNQLGASVGGALATNENFELLQSQSKITGPINFFIYQQDEKGTYSGGGEIPLWGGIRTNACGPGQLSSCTDYLRPSLILESLLNSTLGTLPDLMAFTQSGTGTYSYPGGQAGGCCGYEIFPNSAVPNVVVVSKSNGGSSWGAACFNNTTTTQTCNFAGPGTPSGTITQYIYPNAGETVISNNENTYNFAAMSLAPEDTMPTATSTSGTTMTVPAYSVGIWMYSSSGTPTADTPTFTPPAGTYTGTQSVTLGNPSAAPVVCYNFTGATITIGGVSTCPAGSSTYVGSLSIGTSETIYAKAGGAGFLDSPLGTAAYVINLPTVATPTFAPPTGTYSSTQTVTISTTTGGASLYYTTNGTTPTTGSTPYTGPISVSSTTTVKAIGAEAGYNNSAVGAAVYTILPPASTPTFSPVAGTYVGTQTVTITSSTGGATICYAINTTPTAPTAGTCGAGSTTYSGPISVASSETVNAIATESGYVNSSVGSAAYVIESTVSTPTFSPVAGVYNGAQTITITTSAGATLCYTTDGSTPTATTPGTCSHGTTYSGPFSVGTTETVNAIGTEVGFANSSVASAFYMIEFPAATPTFSPSAGTYPSAQTVTISSTTPSAVICYAINATPTAPTPGTCGAGSTTYSGPITVSSSQTVNAIATLSGYFNSSVGSAAYVIETPAATPTFSPVAGTYTTIQSVTLSDTTPGSSIFYTTNGTTPTPSSTPYTGAISVSATQTIKAIATAPGYTQSAVGSALYTINLATAATPVFVPSGGTYATAQSVTITTSTPSAVICYAVNATPTAPTAGTCGAGSTTYSGPVTVSASETLNAIATEVGYLNSSVGTAVYVILTPAATPTFAPPPGTYSSAQTITISDSTPSSIIYYTTDGTTPTVLSPIYSAPFVISTTTTVKAIATAPGFNQSAVGTAVYTLSFPTAATPTFSPVAGTYMSPQTVTISSTTAGAAIYYTTDGTTPTIASNLYISPVSVPTTTTLKAIAVKSSFNNSAVGTALYTINIPTVATPTFSPIGGTYGSTQTVTISTVTAGATLCYTTNGSTPAASGGSCTTGTQYSTPITVATSQTVQAIGFETGYNNSAVGSATYVITSVVPGCTFYGDWTITQTFSFYCPQ